MGRGREGGREGGKDGGREGGKEDFPLHLFVVIVRNSIYIG